MLIAGVYTADSYLRCLNNLAKLLPATMLPMCRHHTDKIDISELTDIDDFVDSLLHFDQVYLALGSRSSLIISAILRKKKYSGVTVSMYPGLVHKDQIDLIPAFFFADYTIICQKSILDKCRILQGIFSSTYTQPIWAQGLWISTDKINRDANPKSVGFIHQKNLLEKEHIDHLYSYFNNIPKDVSIYFKKRGDDRLTELMRSKSNVIFCDYETLLSRSYVITTISSSGIFECISRDIACNVINDFNPLYFSEIFDSSKLQVPSKQLLSHVIKADVAWVKNYATSPYKPTSLPKRSSIQVSISKVLLLGLCARILTIFNSGHKITSWKRIIQWCKSSIICIHKINKISCKLPSSPCGLSAEGTTQSKL